MIRTELDQKFELKDDPNFTKQVQKDLIFASLIGLTVPILVMVLICHADKVDSFFSYLISKVL